MYTVVQGRVPHASTSNLLTPPLTAASRVPFSFMVRGLVDWPGLLRMREITVFSWLTLSITISIPFSTGVRTRTCRRRRYSTPENDLQTQGQHTRTPLVQEPTSHVLPCIHLYSDQFIKPTSQYDTVLCVALHSYVTLWTWQRNVKVIEFKPTLRTATQHTPSKALRHLENYMYIHVHVYRLSTQCLALHCILVSLREPGSNTIHAMQNADRPEAYIVASYDATQHNTKHLYPAVN